MLLLVRRWYPKRQIVAVADGGYASLRLLERCRHLENPITFLTRLRLDAALYEPAPQAGTDGKTSLERLSTSEPLGGTRRPKDGLGMPITVSGWYGGSERTVEIVSDSAI